MSLQDLDLSGVEESKDFGAVKPVVTRLRIEEIEHVTEGLEDKKYNEYYNVRTAFVDPSTVESVDPQLTPSAPWTKLYTHSPGALKMLRRFIEAHGYSWDEFVASGDREGFLKGLEGAEADAKVKLVTKRSDTGEELENPRNEISYRLPKKQ